MSVPSQCEASLVNNVHNKPINVDIFANYTLQFLFSPNYNDVEDKDYRKSTICRCYNNIKLFYVYYYI